MTKYKLAMVQYENEVILFKNVQGKDYEVENFKYLNSCTRYLNKNYKRIDAYSIDKDYGIYIKQQEVA